MTHHDNDRTDGRDTSTNTTATRTPEITLTGVGDTLAAIPHLLGFHPTDSVVLLSGTERGTPLSRTLRGDLPPDHLVDAVARHITASLADDDVTSALLVIVGGQDGGAQGGDAINDVPPCARLVEALRRELAALGVTEVASYWVPELADGARYRSYDDPARVGVMPDPGSSLLGAEFASRGYVTYGSRAELAALLAPDSEPLLARRAELIESLRAEVTESWPQAARVLAVRAALSAANSGDLALSDRQLATLAIALADLQVRDACLTTALPPDSDLAVAAAVLWAELTRALPAPERAIPACLAGYAAYMSGDGALAAIAFDTALDADPDHVLAGLLDRALRHGFAPHRLHQLATHDAVGLCAGEWSLDASA
ncbi:DUF4192 domain-containing protein [Haloechinothrix halophila]|uniref:DUF4192 domain-containing protein n=1 Tax=Haloechinothrix halophila TaxID=1069073 RepID=UPI0012F8471A|nr:DUF4192 domain-containing protein [Haloechinothrix halophila]